MIYKKIAFSIFLFFFSALAFSQAPPPHKWIEVLVSPNHADWHYRLDEEAEFTVTVLQKNVPMKNITVAYSLGKELMTPDVEREVLITDGAVKIVAGKMNEPGFLRCTVKFEFEGKTYTGWATAGFDTKNIKPTVKKPADFEQFWAKALAENAALPLDTRMTLLPERCTQKVNVYHVSVQNWKSGARLYGILCVPKAEGKYPAVLKVPGAGIRPYQGDVAFAEEGIISFEIGIHGISVIMPQQNYDDLLAGWNNHYWNNNNNDRDEYFYKRVFMGCVRANDLICSLPQWDGKNLAVMGNSQGGALSIVTAALDKRVTASAPVHPAMCDMTGYLHQRAGGWPHSLKDQSKWDEPSFQEVVTTLSYYDAVNFAKQIKVPIWFSFGYNDTTCPPTSVCAAYNSVTSQKEAFLAQESSHWIFPEQQAAQRAWITQQLKGK